MSTIKLLKQGNSIYTRVEEPRLEFDPVNNTTTEVSNFVDLADCKAKLKDTLSWAVGREIVKTLENTMYKDVATTMKGLALLYKIVSGLNPDITTLTITEQDIYNKMLTLYSDGYCDSATLSTKLDTIHNLLTERANVSANIDAATTIDDAIAAFNAASFV